MGDVVASVLLVDDHKLLRDGIRSVLEASGEFEVVAEGSDGREAIALAAEYQPEIILLDIWMPRLSGVDALPEIRRESPGSRIIMMSQHDTGSYVEMALRQGASGYIVKTSASTDLMAALRAAMDHKCYLSPDIAHTVVESFANPSGAPMSTFRSLTTREREVLQLIAEGLSSKEVATQLSISIRTVDSHRTALMAKIGIHKVTGLVRYAIREGLVAP
jgi:DNA-binding NarL/FixJ family response regulator